MKSGLAGAGVLDVKVSVTTEDSDECKFLPENIASVLETCEVTCGVYSADTREIKVFLGCLGRVHTRSPTSIKVLEYTLFHLIAHHLQFLAPSLTRHGFHHAHYAAVHEIDKLLAYSAEVEADYIARAFAFISEEEELKSIPGNRYLYELWPPLSKGIWKMREYCKEVLKHGPPSRLDLGPASVCYNPFRWLISQSTRILFKVRDVLEPLSFGMEVSATLLNRGGVSIAEPIAGLYIDDRSVCFGTTSKRLYACYTSGDSRKIPGAGYELVLEDGLELDLRRVSGLVITFQAPKARIKFIMRGGEVVTEARMHYRGSIPRVAEQPLTINELREAVRSLSADVPLPPGYCDVERQLFVIPLPVPRQTRHSFQRQLVLELSEVLIPVKDLKTCINVEDLARSLW